MAIQVLKSDIKFKHETGQGVEYSSPLDFLIVDQGSTYSEKWDSVIQTKVNSINNNLTTINNFCQGYTTNKKYKIGDYVYYNDHIYCCNKDMPVNSTTWSNDKKYFQRVTISNQLTKLFDEKLNIPQNGTPGQVLTKTLYSTQWRDFPSDDALAPIVAQAIAAWMNENLSIPENQSYILDDGLTLTTAAAQAKATGDAINSLIKISQDQPTEELNKIWIHEIQGGTSVPTQEDLQNIIAPAYTIETSYKEGDYILYNGAMYCITANINAEENTTWDDISKKQINVGEQINNLNDQIEIIKNGEASIDLTEYEIINCTISSTNTILKSGNSYKSYQIPTDMYGSIIITASSRNTMISFLKTVIPNDISNGTNITDYFATGENGRHIINAGDTQEFLLSNDVKYFFITKNSGGNDYAPTNIVVKTRIESKLSNIDTSNIVNFYEAVSTIIENTVTETKIDTTLTHSNEAADAKVTGAEIGDLKSAVVTLASDSITDTSELTWLAGYRVNTSGKAVSGQTTYAGLAYSSWVYALKGSTITAIDGYTFDYAIWDTIIAADTAATHRRTFQRGLTGTVTLEYDGYILLSVSNGTEVTDAAATAANGLVINLLGAKSAVDIARQAEVRSQANGIDNILEYGANLINPAGVTDELLSTDGSITDSASYKLSRFIKVQPGETYVIKSTSSLGQYDGGKRFRSKRSFSDTANPTVFIVPTWCEYVRLNTNVTPLKWVFNTGETLTDEEYKVPTLRDVSLDNYLDNTLAVTGKAADAKKTGDAIADARTEIESEIGLIARITSGGNLANPANTESGNITADGEPNESTSYNRSVDFIPVVPGGTYTFKAIVNVCGYNANKVFQQRKAYTTTAERTVTLPADWAYVKLTSNTNVNNWRFNAGTTLIDEAWQAGNVELSENVLDTTLAVQGKAADAKATGDAIASANSALINHTVDFETLNSHVVWPENPVISSDVVAGILQANGSINESATYKVSVFFPIKASTLYTNRTNGTKVLCYDYAKNPISGAFFTLLANGQFTTPANAVYARLTSNVNPTKWQLSEGNTLLEYTAGHAPLLISDQIDSASRYYKGPFDINVANLGGWYEVINTDYSTHSFSHTTTYAEIITLFDALVTAGNGYVTKSSIGTAEGTDSQGNSYTIYMYTFKPRRRTNANVNKKMPKILMDASIHGFEKNSTYAVYAMFYDLVHNWTQSPILSELHNHVEFQVVPVSNPWGFDNDDRRNVNGVNLNRNFPSNNWSSSAESGAEPLDQSEAAALATWIQANPDMMMYFNIHTNGHYYSASYPEANYCNLSSDNTDEYYLRLFAAMARHIEDQTAYLAHEFNAVNPTYQQFIGIIHTGNEGGDEEDESGSAIPGTVKQYVNTYLGIALGMTYELFNGLKDNETTIFNVHTADSIKACAEILCDGIIKTLAEYGGD